MHAPRAVVAAFVGIQSQPNAELTRWRENRPHRRRHCPRDLVSAHAGLLGCDGPVSGGHTSMAARGLPRIKADSAGSIGPATHPPISTAAKYRNTTTATCHPAGLGAAFSYLTLIP